MSVATIIRDALTDGTRTKIFVRLLKQQPAYPYVLNNFVEADFPGYCETEFTVMSYIGSETSEVLTVAGVATFRNTAPMSSSSISGLAVVAITDPEILMWVETFDPPQTVSMEEGSLSFNITLTCTFADQFEE